MLAGVALLLFGYVTTWYRALKFAPATQVAGVLVGATVITSILRAIFITRVFTIVNLGQAVLILTGMYLVTITAINGWKNSDKLVQETINP
jgi:predicted tellurium resistance membrane protein TerC